MVEEIQLEPLMHTLGKKWTYPILEELSHHSHGFEELKQHLTPITSKILSERLRELQSLQLINRNPQMGKEPVRVLYRIRKRGKILGETINQIKNKLEATM